MRIIKPYYEIITPIDGEQILKQIELAARTCYKSEDKICEGSSHTLVAKLLNLHHEAMIEFGGMITVKFVCDRGVSHELVRHRLCSFAQESTRYCNYGKKKHITFIIPEWLPNVKEGEYDFLPEFEHEKQSEEWCSLLLSAEKTYNFLIKQGWLPGQARSVLPNSLKTEINLSANIRGWRHIFQQRVAKTAHTQMRELMQPLLDEFKLKIPLIFDDITY